MDALTWRFVGPYRGGRVMAVAGHPTERRIAYFGSTGGGVWRTTDGGTSWHNLSDRFFKRSSVGALAIAPSDPSVIYVGMGECGYRSNVTHGDGVYGTTDGGKTWRHLGLAATHNIARLRVHPHDPDLVYVAAMGHRFGPNPERGVYRSVDGGRHWRHILSRDPATGAADLIMDPRNPRILYAALWEARRYPWGFASGGPGSGIAKSDDGGETWRDLSGQPGLPRGVKGKIALTVSPGRPDRLYALIAAPEGGGIYRSSDGGETWTWINNDPNFLVRGWYDARIEADPFDPDTIWLPNRKLWKSVDGGRTFAQLNTSYWDQHDLWVDPRDNRHLVLGNDGGASVSEDGGATWSSVFNQPTAELYHAGTDTRVPYRVYTAQQDSSTLSLPSRSDFGPISEKDWYDVGGGESGFIVARPDNPDIVFAGDLGGVLTRYDHHNGQLRDISPCPENMAGWDTDSLPYRFNWSQPLLLSRHEPCVLYVGGNCLFRSEDEGQSWRVISPDLTRHDPATLRFLAAPDARGRWRESGEDEDYATIASLAEGIEPGVIWTGSDDGRVHLTRDGGQTWRDVTPKDLPEWANCCIEASPHRPGGAYLSATRHRLDDFRPYLFRTSDYGATWEAIAEGIPEAEFTRVVRADPAREGLLYCGTEAGVFSSLDDGARWRPLQANLPACAVYDLAVHTSGDLIAATHGRGLWILDDLTPLYQLTDAVAREPVHLFRPRPAYRLIRQIVGTPSYMTMGYPDAAPNPPAGLEVTYSLRDRPEGEVILTLFDDQGQPIATYGSAVPMVPAAPLGPLAHQVVGGRSVLIAPGDESPEPGLRVGMRPTRGRGQAGIVPAAAGYNRFIVPLIAPGAPGLPGSWPLGSTEIPLPPGSYSLRLSVDGRQQSVPATILPDPRVTATPEDYQIQFQVLLEIRALVAAIHAAVSRLRQARDRIVGWAAPFDADGEGPVQQAAMALIGRLSASEEILTQPRLTNRSGELSSSHFPIRLDGKLESLASTIAGCDARPTAQAQAAFHSLAARVTTELQTVQELTTRDLARLNQLIREAGLPAVAPLSEHD